MTKADFVKRVARAADLTNDQLGAPPPRGDYPAPVLDYSLARRRRLRCSRWESW